MCSYTTEFFQNVLIKDSQSRTFPAHPFPGFWLATPLSFIFKLLNCFKRMNHDRGIFVAFSLEYLGSRSSCIKYYTIIILYAAVFCCIEGVTRP